jgi:hypothetical protein
MKKGDPMNKIKLKKMAVEKLPHTEKGKQVDYYDSDLNGFGIRASHTGKIFCSASHKY